LLQIGTRLKHFHIPNLNYLNYLHQTDENTDGILKWFTMGTFVQKNTRNWDGPSDVE